MSWPPVWRSRGSRTARRGRRCARIWSGAKPRRLLPVIHLLQQLIDREQALLAAPLAAEDRVVPPFHPDRPIEIAAERQPAAGDELQKDLLVRRACQSPVGE